MRVAALIIATAEALTASTSLRYRAGGVATLRGRATPRDTRLAAAAPNNEPARPKCVVFDLDGCLWEPEMFMMSWSGGAPFTADGDDMVAVSGERVRLLGAVREVCAELRTDAWAGVRVGISSRTDEPAWARELLEKFRIDDGGDGFALKDLFDVVEISKESKTAHFRRIAESQGVDLEDMLFFDNERGNCVAIADLGVTVSFCPDGVTADAWREALDAFPAPGVVVSGGSSYYY
mmetsp:Transcript_9671/g.28925  ORF Transcript_9671/g.28925 Transcript_9671/m.28925 type:complete len:235 (-) Transcript_9671:2-706(-)